MTLLAPKFPLAKTQFSMAPSLLRKASPPFGKWHHHPPHCSAPTPEGYPQSFSSSLLCAISGSTLKFYPRPASSLLVTALVPGQAVVTSPLDCWSELLIVPLLLSVHTGARVIFAKVESGPSPHLPSLYCFPTEPSTRSSSLLGLARPH